MVMFYRDKRFWFVSVASLIALAIYFFWDASFLIRSIATVAFLFIFYFGDKVYRIGFVSRHYVYIILLVVAGVLASPLYFIWPQYDKLQHFVMPILMSAMTFHMVGKLPLSSKWKLWHTFFVVVALLGMFEVVEYSIDHFFDFKLQGVFLRDASGVDKLQVLQEPLDDTMIDILLGILGASVYGIYKGLHLRIKRQ